MLGTDQENTVDSLISLLANIAVESWRFSRVYERMLMKMDASEQSRYKSQLRWHEKKVEEALAEAQLSIVNLEGLAFETGMAVTPINIDEFNASDYLIVDQMLEPIIMRIGNLVRTGTVTLRKV